MNHIGQSQFSSEIRTITVDTFEQEVLKSPLPVVVDFWAPWCGPCRVLTPILDQLAQDFAGRVIFGKVNIDDNETLAGELGIQAVPTVLFFSGDSVSLVTVGVKQRQEMATIISTFLDQISKES